MTSTIIIKAKSIITMDPANPRAEAVVIENGIIKMVGDFAQCRAAFPKAAIENLDNTVLMPGFIDSHGHPLLAGISTMPPAGYIAPWVAPTWDDVVAIFKEQAKGSDLPLIFFGFDQLLHGIDEPTAKTLDAIFGDRLVAVVNNSGHGAYVTSAVLKKLGYLDNPPQDPVGGKFLRDVEGNLTGQAHELPAVIAFMNPILNSLGANPLFQAAQYFKLMAEAGITATTEMTYSQDYQKAYEALANTKNCPLRISAYHMSTETNASEPVTFNAPQEKLMKQGVKLWADGSPWIGNIAISFPYLDSPVLKRAHIQAGVPGLAAMNYTREQLDAVLAENAPKGWQMAFHVNGDLGFNMVLDAYEAALKKFNLLGTDHRWRVEHVGAAQADQFKRAASLGVVASMAPFQFYYWGDLLDGKMFETRYGANWQQFKAAFSAGVHPSFHNDGSVSPPNPLLNIQTAVTRRTSSGTVRGIEHAITLDEALAAETINAAYSIHRDNVTGSIAAGKWADFVELSADPYQVKPERIASDIHILHTWVGGQRIDLTQFTQEVKQLDPKSHTHLEKKGKHCCC